MKQAYLKQLRIMCRELIERILRHAVPVEKLDAELRESLTICVNAAFDKHDEDGIPFRFQCPICLKVLSSPVSLLCGHIFCRECISKYHERRSSCPNRCSSHPDDMLLPQGNLEREIRIWLELNKKYQTELSWTTFWASARFTQFRK
jgi:hypothetical protein